MVMLRISNADQAKIADLMVTGGVDERLEGFKSWWSMWLYLRPPQDLVEEVTDRVTAQLLAFE